MNDFLKYIKSRGYLHQCTNEAGVTQSLKKSTSAFKSFPKIWSQTDLITWWRNNISW